MRAVNFRARALTFSRVAAASPVLLLLAACPEKPTEPTSAPPPAATANTVSGEIDWARAALQRNPTLEIVATDTAAGVFTVRDRATGDVRAVKLSELAAAPIATFTASARAATTAALPTEATAAPAQPPQPTVAPASSSASAAASPGTSPSVDASSNSNYTIQREGGQLKVSGPGVSIVSTGPAAVSATTGEQNQAGTDPIICEGRRMLHFDNRNIYVQGDAIVARGGCELYITNSRVSAEGTGVVIQDATVHIANSTIQGTAASFDASDASKVYLRNSTFQGLPRRAEKAVVQDQGGNQWR